MERMRIAAIFADQESLGGREVTVCGWARTIRDMKTFGFIELNDGSCFRNLQVVMSAEELSNYKEIAAQNVGASLIVRVIHSGRKVKRNTCLAERILKYNQVFRQKALPQDATEQKLKKAG